MEKKVSLIEFEGNPNIGLYIFVNDKFCLIGKEINLIKKKEIEKIFKVPVYNVSVLGTELVGVFVAGNNDILLIPQMPEHEKKIFEDVTKKHEVKLLEFSDRLNTLGNNLCVGNDEILSNPDYPEKFLNLLKEKSGLKIVKIENPNYKSAGAICAFINGKYYISQELEESEVKSIKKKIAGVGSVNSGNNYVASGIVGNSFGLLLGTACSTVEIQNAVESLDFL